MRVFVINFNKKETVNQSYPRILALTEIGIGVVKVPSLTVYNVLILALKVLSLHALWENRNIKTEGWGAFARSVQFLKDFISPILYLLIAVTKYLLQFVYLIKPLPVVDQKMAKALNCFDLTKPSHIVKLRSDRAIKREYKNTLRPYVKLLQKHLPKDYKVSMATEGKIVISKNKSHTTILPGNISIFDYKLICDDKSKKLDCKLQGLAKDYKKDIDSRLNKDDPSHLPAKELRITIDPERERQLGRINTKLTASYSEQSPSR